MQHSKHMVDFMSYLQPGWNKINQNFCHTERLHNASGHLLYETDLTVSASAYFFFSDHWQFMHQHFIEHLLYSRGFSHQWHLCEPEYSELLPWRERKIGKGRMYKGSQQIYDHNATGGRIEEDQGNLTGKIMNSYLEQVMFDLGTKGWIRFQQMEIK